MLPSKFNVNMFVKMCKYIELYLKIILFEKKKEKHDMNVFIKYRRFGNYEVSINMYIVHLHKIEMLTNA